MSVRSLARQQAYFQQYHSESIYQSFAHKMAAKAGWHRNYVTVHPMYMACTFVVSKPSASCCVACSVDRHIASAHTVYLAVALAALIRSSGIPRVPSMNASCRSPPSLQCSCSVSAVIASLAPSVRPSVVKPFSSVRACTDLHECQCQRQ